jgi:Peptidase family M28
MLMVSTCFSIGVAGPRPEDAITEDALKAHVRFLSDDLLEGRGTATRGHEIAARYVASEFESMGLKPAGDNNTFFQTVHLRRTEFKQNQSAFSLVMNGEEKPQTLETDWYSVGDVMRKDTSAEGKVVFVGMGLVAPEMKHDDYAGIDVRGKIAAILPGAPEKWETTTRAYYSSTYLKAKNAAEHGAIGVIALWSPELEKIYPWRAMLNNEKFPAYQVMGKDGVPFDTYPELKARIAASVAKSKEILATSGENPEALMNNASAGKTQSFELPVTAKIHILSELEDATSPNVVAVLPGSDPQLKNEYVVYSAHLDHLGIGPPDKGDRINNGAYDNASGSAVLMEVARAFASMPTGPKRSVLFVNVTGEEKGLLGAYYFSRYPTVPEGSIVADINLDEIASLFPLKDVVAFGAEHSSLNDDVKAAAKETGFEISPDPYPEQVYFIRSDQFPFVRRGIPAIFISPGMKSSDSKVDGKAIYTNWLENLYHTPHDEFTLPFDWPSNVRLAKLNFLIGERVANAPKRPAWKKNDIFQQKFGGPTAD